MEPHKISYLLENLDFLKGWSKKISIIIDHDLKLPTFFNSLSTEVVENIQRVLNSKAFNKINEGNGLVVFAPLGMLAYSIQLIKLQLNANISMRRIAGSNIAIYKDSDELLVLGGDQYLIEDISFGLALRCYNFSYYKMKQVANIEDSHFMLKEPQKAIKYALRKEAVTAGIFLTRDLVNEPANILNTTEFADRLKALEPLGLKVKILEENELEKMGMYALLSVGKGSVSPSKVVILEWCGGNKSEASLALVGKGVVFDTGGISIKPASGMESMTMDMGGAGVVAGVMKSLAIRKAKANVVGFIGLVENMPDGGAMRPGDIIKSMKGDTIEVINTDAEGRLVLCDLLWLAQKEYSVHSIIDLATLTGAIIVGLGHENAGVFSNNDSFCNDFLAAASSENEGVWRMPLDKGYQKQLKSNFADVANVGGRPAGAITAAKFLERFVEKDVPWIHIDIAGVAVSKGGKKLSTSGATGWGVLSVNRFIEDKFEN